MCRYAALLLIGEERKTKCHRAPWVDLLSQSSVLVLVWMDVARLQSKNLYYFWSNFKFIGLCNNSHISMV